MFFKSKLAAMLVSLAAFLTVLIAGAIAIAYTILPDIGVFSVEQKIIIGIYFAACLTTLSYAAYSSYVFWVEVRREYSIPGGMPTKLLWMPLIGSFAMLYMMINLARKHSIKLGKVAIFLSCLTGIYILSVMTLFVDKKGFDLILLVSLIFTVTNGSIFLYIASRLSTVPVGIGAKVLTAVLLTITAGTIIVSYGLNYYVNREVEQAEDKLSGIYGFPITSGAVKDLYYHGLEPNYKKFRKILPQDPKDKTGLLALPKFPEELECYYMQSVANEKLDVKLKKWVQSKSLFFQEYDWVLQQEDYLKMSEKYRDYSWILGTVMLSELNPLRHWARADRARVINAVNNGDSKEALRVYQQMSKIRDFSLDDTFAISSLVGMAIETIRLAGLQYMIGNGKLTDAEIKKIIVELVKDRNIWDSIYRKAMYGETVSYLGFFDIYQRMNCWLYFYCPEKWPQICRKNVAESNEILNFMVLPIKYCHKKDELYSHEFYIKNAEIPPDGEALERIREQIPASALLSRIAMFASHLFYEKNMMIKNCEAAAVTALQVELYRRKYRKLPRKLTDLVPEFASKIPIDLYSGKPLKYIHNDITLLLVDARKGYSLKDKRKPLKINGYKVYSVGFNKSDDKGFQGQYQDKYYDDIGFYVIYSVKD